MPKRVWLVGILVGAALVVLTIACEDGEEQRIVTEEEDTVVEEAVRPSVEIMSLSDGKSVQAGDLLVSVQVSNVEIVEKLGQANVSGEGHVHFFLLGPDESVPTTAGQPAVTSQGTYHAEATTSYTWPDVAPGAYKVAVQLVNNDHTPLSPPLVDEIHVEVAGAEAGDATPAGTPAMGY